MLNQEKPSWGVAPKKSGSSGAKIQTLQSHFLSYSTNWQELVAHNQASRDLR